MGTFYEDNATEFFHATVDVDMTPIYEKFLPLIPHGGHILDAGCSSGRDARHFLASGYEVTAFDASRELCELASEHLGADVHCLRFEDVERQAPFDAVWACASLLHVPRAQLQEAFDRLVRAVKVGGVLYISFKLGAGERQKGGRHFTDLDESGLQELIDASGKLQLIEQWRTEDRRPDRDDTWLNALVRKASSM
ncbi:MAG: class I SAM-dependent methyltransferase [Oceanospirillaceae bacterium]|nr:class I SAM-dependent methyltransferase [Oceanospirillaceae bacterium]